MINSALSRVRGRRRKTPVVLVLRRSHVILETPRNVGELLPMLSLNGVKHRAGFSISRARTMEISADPQIRTHWDNARVFAHELGAVAPDIHPNFLSAELLAR
jgi:hypothetical protein